MVKSSIEILIEKIPRHGMSADCQKFLPYAISQYFKGELLEGLNLTQRKKGFAKEIYKRLERIKMDGLKKTTSVMSRHPEDYKEDLMFADTIITYCTKYSNLQKGMFRLFDKVFDDEEPKEMLRKRYRNGDKCDVRRQLQTLGRHPLLYNFVVDKILGKTI